MYTCTFWRVEKATWGPSSSGAGSQLEQLRKYSASSYVVLPWLFVMKQIQAHFSKMIQIIIQFVPGLLMCLFGVQQGSLIL